MPPWTQNLGKNLPFFSSFSKTRNCRFPACSLFGEQESFFVACRKVKISARTIKLRLKLNLFFWRIFGQIMSSLSLSHYVKSDLCLMAHIRNISEESWRCWNLFHWVYFSNTKKVFKISIKTTIILLFFSTIFQITCLIFALVFFLKNFLADNCKLFCRNGGPL